MDGFSGVRKGAWTKEEDELLKRCVEKYGEGKWHQVPSRAGLNRCRKSCRLRWLNYLKPDIKRGEFAMDEVDLLLRLHKLLGNRWSLIAGRLPGRTANDVKNYWNTHLHKKYGKHITRASNNDHQKMVISESCLLKPRPRTFTKALPWMKSSTQKASGSTTMAMVDNSIHHQEESPGQPIGSDSPLEKDTGWWESLLNDTLEASNNPNPFAVKISRSDGEPNNNMAAFSVEDVEPTAAQGSNGVGDAFIEDNQSFWRDLLMSMDIWDL